MAELKTKKTNDSVEAFLDTVADEQKRKDAYEVMKLMTEVTKEPAKMWGTAIVGFGSYHYKYDSGHEGDMCMVGFSPRKTALTLYVMGSISNEALMSKLGKYKTGKGCLYINKLADVDKAVLKSVIKDSYNYVKKKYK